MAPWWLPFGRVPELTADTLARDLVADPPQIIDVRSTAEYNAGHIPGAVSVPLPSLAGRVASLGLDPARPVVAICLTAHRSVPAVRLLTRHGYDARQLAGGMRAWRKASLPEEKDRG